MIESTQLERQALSFRNMIEDEGGKAFVIGVSIKTSFALKEPRYDVSVTRSLSTGTTTGEARAYMSALQREIVRVGALLGDSDVAD